MKRLRFSEPLPELVLKREKDTTWRINDDKNLSVGDELSLCCTDNTEYAKAKIVWVKDTTFGELTAEDKAGHEKFTTEKELYDTYSQYYSMKVLPETPVRVIKFRIIS